MKIVRLISIVISVLLFGMFLNCGDKANKNAAEKIHYEPNWESLSQWEVPQWFDDAVLGIYCHWSVYSVPGYRFDSGSEQVDSGLWYGRFMYIPNDSG